MIKFAIIGIGNRAIKCYIKPLVNEFSDKCKLVGLYDINFPRAKYISKTLPYKVNVFYSLTTMIEECHFDYCIICSKDSSHFQIIKELLDHGKKIICEKPIVIKKNEVDYLYFNNNKNLVNVVHNCRLMPINKTIKNLLSNNVVGNVLQIDYIANIDLKHGREYFRRWHSEYKNTGGLLIHKSSHHFDLLNWWLNCMPQNLCAFGKLNYFGNNKKFNNDNTNVAKAINMLSPQPKRRFIKYYIDGKTYNEIAIEEGKHISSIYESISGARKKFLKYLAFFENAPEK